MIEIRNLALPLSAGGPSATGTFRGAAARRLRVDEGRIVSLRLLKRSVDARRKSNVHFVATLGVTLDAAGDEDEAAVVRRMATTTCSSPPPSRRPPSPRLGRAPEVRPVVVGTGPAGLFAALVLARAGARPLVLERGAPVDRRVRAVSAFMRDGVLDPDSNIQFGEGGAGTFSDGKLTTSTQRPPLPPGPRRVRRGGRARGDPLAGEAAHRHRPSHEGRAGYPQRDRVARRRGALRHASDRPRARRGRRAPRRRDGRAIAGARSPRPRRSCWLRATARATPSRCCTVAARGSRRSRSR